MSKACGCSGCSTVKPYRKATHAATLHHLVHPGDVHLLPWEEETRGYPRTSFFTQNTLPKILPLFLLLFLTAATCYLLAQLKGKCFPA